MVNSIIQIISSIRLTLSKTSSAHTYLQEIIEKSSSSPIPNSSNKVAIDISLLEEIATIITILNKNDRKQKQTLEILNNESENIFKIWENIKLLRHDLFLFQTSFEKDYSELTKMIKQIVSVHKEYKTRCQISFLDFLKGIDIDLRKILKPLVPSSVIKEQVKFPMINTNSSLRSSVQSIEESNNENLEEPSLKSQPEPSEVTIQKLNSHIQMLVGTLENIAKDLIQVLAEADREYYQLLNKQDVYSRPQTPLAAPLPDYFCYEVEETPRESTMTKQVLTNESKEMWIKRLNKLHQNKQIRKTLYQNLISKLEKSSETHKLDLKDLFLNTEITISERENLVYYLINGSTEFDKHVSMSQMVSETKLKPEPPKSIKPKGKALFKIEKELEKRSSPVNNSPDLEVARISQGSMNSQGRIVNSIRLVSKSPKIERFFKNRKSVRVRSITPVGKDKVTSSKARTPSVQNGKVSLNTFYAKHRLRRNAKD
ncbi:hypothetical protein SteCoe_17649 [Stentor coeruleus]|uniref:Uncharacterized protein n=1 Tax=Stentor coeruleus TaxID=5963 RepID=A0A1R2BYX1_9CILI|nr:hypothetical protein SteCoe_17649 [Stentor coeruleus]